MHKLDPIERLPDGTLFRLTPGQLRSVRGLTKRCCNFLDGDCLLLDGPLSAVVEIDGGHVSIRGMRGAWRASTPADIGLGETWNGVRISPDISDFEWNV